VPHEEDTQIVPVDDLVATPSGEAHMVVLSGSGLGRMFPVGGRPMIIGRSLSADIVVDDVGVSRQHAVVEQLETATKIRDMGSTNGTWVEGERVGPEGRVLENGVHIRIGPGTILKYGFKDELENKLLNALYQSATRDGLTGVYNRRYFSERLKGEVAYHKRHKLPLSLLLLDIDHFKRLNDTYGHPYGDAVLKQVAIILSQGVRAEDVVVRYGGEEFAIICRQTEPNEALNIAERIRSMVARTRFTDQRIETRATISIGVGTLTGSELTSAESLVELVDQNLYRAKSGGRNCIRA
jgi:two-component system, cell cycle response regulator